MALSVIYFNFKKQCDVIFLDGERKSGQNPTSTVSDEERGAGFSFACVLDFLVLLGWD